MTNVVVLLLHSVNVSKDYSVMGIYLYVDLLSIFMSVMHLLGGAHEVFFQHCVHIFDVIFYIREWAQLSPTFC